MSFIGRRQCHSHGPAAWPRNRTAKIKRLELRQRSTQELELESTTADATIAFDSPRLRFGRPKGSGGARRSRSGVRCRDGFGRARGRKASAKLITRHKAWAAAYDSRAATTATARWNLSSDGPSSDFGTAAAAAPDSADSGAAAAGSGSLLLAALAS
eukprot:Amastigsp_a677951_30.p2 type:complete len:157 gc:universal Amastigsp_a677951_30:2-472(+)